uniref:Uncharacterized protein n=1 Tax=Anguilla anguilla TaxID=7936 RepID=A0A0E9UKY1_ANGAN
MRYNSKMRWGGGVKCQITSVKVTSGFTSVAWL